MATDIWYGIFGVRGRRLFSCMAVTETGAIGAATWKKLQLRVLKLLQQIFRGWVPGILPISPKWRFVLFGLASIQFSRHPEGLIEYGKRRVTRRFNERFDLRECDRTTQKTSS